MLIVTSDHVAGREVTVSLGLVRGSTVRAKHLAGAREQAIDRMITQAEDLGADAIIAMRLETSTIQQGTSEVLAYGTAVRLG